MMTMTRRTNVKNKQVGVCGDMHTCHHQCTVTIHHREERGWVKLIRCGKLLSTSRRGRLTVWWWIRNTHMYAFRPSPPQKQVSRDPMSTVMVIHCGFGISSSLCQKQKIAIGRVSPPNTAASFMGRHQQRARSSVNEPQRTTRRREMSWRRVRIRQDPTIRHPRIRQVRAAAQPCQDRTLDQPLSTPSLTKNCVWVRWLVGE